MNEAAAIVVVADYALAGVAAGGHMIDGPRVRNRNGRAMAELCEQSMCKIKT